MNKRPNDTAKITAPGKVTLIGHIDVPREQVAVVTAALAEHITLTRNEPGCLVFEVTPDYAVFGRFSVYEEFANIGAFHAHQRRIKGSAWEAVTANAKRDYSVTGI